MVIAAGTAARLALQRLGIRLPIIQAPMAGTSTPQLAAAVSNAGGLGSIGIGANDPAGARAAIQQLQQLTDRPFNVNVFVHRTPIADASREMAWIQRLTPQFAEFASEPPERLRVIYKSFAEDAEMLEVLRETRPPIVSFHFGLPSTETIHTLKGQGTILLATATSPAEAQVIEETEVDFIVAQGFEAGGHRGIFDPDGPDDSLSTLALTRLLVRRGKLPIIAAGGIMDGAGIAAVLRLGAVAAQLGTAFIACPESAADEGFRQALRGPGSFHTRMTSIISGRPARCLSNRFTDLEASLAGLALPDYPISYDLGKALHAAAKAKGEYGFGAQWAGQGAPLTRAMPAEELVRILARELGETDAWA